MQRNNSRARVAAMVALSAGVSLLVGACGDDTAEPEEQQDPLAVYGQEMTENYASIVLASYQDSLTEAQRLDASIGVFVGGPTQATLDAARQVWLDSREPYLQTEVYRFYDGPIDNPDDGPEGLINAWPLDEAYIDYVEGDDSSGIVNDASQTIDADALMSLNEQGGEENIATGFHAIEFLLWGQDLSADSAGQRPPSDYLTDGTGTAANQDRRAQYLQTASGLLVGHLELLVDAWSEDEDNYRAELEASEPKEALRRILTGMIVLSGFETGGERLQAALDSGDQEDEHSCFSDNTHRDMIQDIQGIMNVWTGSYTRLDGSTISGVGIRQIVEEADPELAATLDAQIQESLDLANALDVPFDQEIDPDNPDGNARVEALIVALRAQEGLLEDVFRMFELEVPVVE